MNERFRVDPFKLAVLFMAGIVAVAVIGTAVAIVFKLPGTKTGPSVPGTVRSTEKPSVSSRDFGTFRGKTSDPKPRVFAVRIAFNPGTVDGDFADELFRKEADLKQLCTTFLSGKIADDLLPEFEGRIKAELRDRMNATLMLGKIQEVFFYDFQVIE